MTSNLSESDKRKRKDIHTNVRAQMSSSLLLPIALGLIILLAGIVLAIFAPWSFTTTISIFIIALLFAYLVWGTRGHSLGLRILALIVAIPAVVGIALSLVNGRLNEALFGVGLTILLLVILRFFSTPISYRVASNRFRNGRTQDALEMINKSINARPDFWESYQLRSLIFLTQLKLDLAERDAKTALDINPKAHPVYNTLGQIYLAQEEFALAGEAYGQALDLAPGYALYLYHLGLCEFRLQDYNEAVLSFSAASQGTLPLVEYDLQNTYYLLRSYEALGDMENAAKVEARLENFRSGMATIKKQLNNQPPYPHLEQMKADAADLQRRLAGLAENG